MSERRLYTNNPFSSASINNLIKLSNNLFKYQGTTSERRLPLHEVVDISNGTFWMWLYFYVSEELSYLP